MAASSPSEGEAAVAAMLGAARQIFEGMQQGDSAALAERVRALHADYEQHWSRVQAAARAQAPRDPGGENQQQPGRGAGGSAAARELTREERAAAFARAYEKRLQEQQAEQSQQQ